MTRLSIPASSKDAPAPTHAALAAVERQLGVVPNLFLLLATSPPALEGYLGLNAALGKTLDAATRERIALAVAEFNGCDYCLSAHTYLGRNVAKLGDEELELNRMGRSRDAKADAAVRLARRIVETRGRVAQADLSAARAAGFADAQIVEIVAVVAINVLTNFVNNVAETPIDFPVVHAAAAA